MKLRAHTMLLVVGAFLLFALSMFFCLEIILKNEYEELERRTVQNDMLRVANLVGINENSQLAITEDYAVWTETYDFIQKPDKTYLSNNWPDSVFSRFQLHSIFFTDLTGKIVAAKSVNPDTGKEDSIPPEQTAFINSHSPTWAKDNLSKGSVGIFKIDEKPILLAMQPVFDNDKLLAADGLIITLRPFDDDVISQLSDSARLPLALEMTAGSGDERPYTATVSILSEEKIKGEYVFPDYYGEPILRLYSITNRHIHAAGDHSISYSVMAFLLLGSLFSLAAPFALDRFILRRLEFLIKDIDDITWTKQSKETVRVIGRDEFAGLAAKINEMLVALFAEKKLRLAAMHKIEEMNRDLELRVLQKTNELEQQFFIDQLTGLPNRFCLSRDYQDTLNPAIAILQLRDFRRFSEFWGHEAADAVEKELAERLERFAHSSKVVVYHFSTGEFAFLAISTPTEQLVNLATFTQKMLEGLTVSFQEHAHNFSVTIGIAAGKPNGIEKALMAIDFARKQRLSIQVYKDSLPTREDCRNNLYWIQEVQNAIREGRILLYFQPIKNAVSNAVDKYEVLVRLQTREGAIILPGEFLAIIKQTALYHQLSAAIYSKAFHYFAPRKEHFSLNIAASDIADDTIRALIREALRQTALAGRVCFELLESDEFKNQEVLDSFIAEVKRAGAQIAIDDFGSGYCNFSQIARMAADYIKIDGELIKQLGHNTSAQSIVQSIVEFSHALGAKVIAEHVHSDEIIQIASELGIDFLQGFRIGHPLAEIPEPTPSVAKTEAEEAVTPIKLLPEPNWTQHLS